LRPAEKTSSTSADTSAATWKMTMAGRWSASLSAICTALPSMLESYTALIALEATMPAMPVTAAATPANAHARDPDERLGSADVVAESVARLATVCVLTMSPVPAPDGAVVERLPCRCPPSGDED